MCHSIPYLSLIIPAYNEAATIDRTLSAARQYLVLQPWQWEVVVCADGNDGTRERAVSFAAGDDRFCVMGSPERRGKGFGVRAGAGQARGAVVGFLDADYKTPIEEIEKVLPWFERGFDAVIGSRRVPGASIEARQPLYRRAGSRVFGAMMRRFMGLPHVRDTQCGFKFFSRAAAQELFSLQRIDGYMFDIELLRLCRLLNLQVKEVGVRWRDDGDSRYHPVIGTLRNARELLRIRRLRYPIAPSAAATESPRVAA